MCEPPKEMRPEHKDLWVAVSTLQSPQPGCGLGGGSVFLCEPERPVRCFILHGAER